MRGKEKGIQCIGKVVRDMIQPRCDLDGDLQMRYGLVLSYCSGKRGKDEQRWKDYMAISARNLANSASSSSSSAAFVLSLPTVKIVKIMSKGVKSRKQGESYVPNFQRSVTDPVEYQQA